MQRELEDQVGALQSADEHSKRALADASHMAEQLRQEQSTTAHVDKARRMLESQVRELQARLDEAENSSRAGGKRVAQQLENRVSIMRSQNFILTGI